MDLERYYELRTILQQWKRRLAHSVRDRIVESAHWLERLREIYASEGTDEAFTEWLDRAGATRRPPVHPAGAEKLKALTWCTEVGEYVAMDDPERITISPSQDGLWRG